MLVRFANEASRGCLKGAQSSARETRRFLRSSDPNSRQRALLIESQSILSHILVATPPIYLSFNSQMIWWIDIIRLECDVGMANRQWEITKLDFKKVLTVRTPIADQTLVQDLLLKIRLEYPSKSCQAK